MARKPKRDERWEEAIRRLDTARVVCLDTETSGLDWKRNHIVGWVLTFGPAPQDSYYLPVRHAGGGNIKGHKGPQEAEGWDGKPHPIEKELLDRLARVQLIFGHNMDFDLKFAMRAGLKIDTYPRIEDTIINAPLLDEWQANFSLDYCAKLARVQAKKGETLYRHIADKFGLKEGDRNTMGHFWRLAGDDPLAVEYAEGDGTTTWQLRDWQMRQIANQELGTVHDIESRLIPVLARMSFRGIRIDVERLEELRQWVDVEISSKLDMWFPAGFNTKSPSDVEKWCRDQGHTDWPLTSKGRPSFTEAWLSTHEAGRKIVTIRKLQTLKNSFLEPMATEHLWNGRVHPTYHQMRGDEYGTVTGRLSCSNPNLQAVSKRDKEIGKLHRSIFIPDEGRIWANADYKQCEPVLLAHYSQCKVLLDGYRANPPMDAHSSVAKATGLDRETGKRVNQTLITGGGKGVLVSRYGIPEAEVHRIWKEYFARMPEIRYLQKKAARIFRKRGYVLSLLGRRARLRDQSKDYTAVNRLLQCGNADIIKLKMVEIDEYLGSVGRPVDLLNNIHDDLAFQFRPEDRQHYEECLRIMQNFGEDSLIELSVPLGVDTGEGKNWAEATYGGK